MLPAKRPRRKFYGFRTPAYFRLQARDSDATPGVLWDGLKEFSTVHGLQNYYKSRGLVKRLFWIATLLLMTAGLCYNLTGLTASFLGYPVKVDVSIVRNRQEMVFPAVTVCNLNPVRKSAFDSLDNSQKQSADVGANTVRKRKRRKRTTEPCGQWQCYQGYSYCISSSALTLASAESMCRLNYSATLLSLRNIGEYQFAQKLILASFKSDCYLGAIRDSMDNSDKEIVYFDKTPSAPSDTWWAPEEPNGSGMCVRIYIYNTNSFQLRDTDCSVSYKYICRKKSSSCLTTIPYTTTTLVTTSNAATTSTTKVPTTTTAHVTTQATTETTADTTTTTEITTETTQGSTAKTTTATTLESTTETTTTRPTTLESTLETTTTTTLEFTTKTTTVIPTTLESTTETTTEIDIEATTTAAITSSSTTTTLSPTSLTTSEDQTTLEEFTSTTIPTTSSTYLVTTTMTSPPVVNCCCRCCFIAENNEACNTCINDTIERASDCASQQPVQPTTSVLMSTSGPFLSTTVPPLVNVQTFTAPPPLNGSRFAERTQFTKPFLTGESFLEMMATLTEKDKIDIGYSLKGMILECKYGDSKCANSEFESFYNSLHGNCFVFNSGWNISQPLRAVHQNGKTNGLRMTVNIGQGDYISNIGDTAGIRVIVHPQKLMPFPEDEGITVSPGLFSSISINKAVVSLKPLPYGNCSQNISNEAGRNFYAVKYPVDYSTRACEKTCYQRHLISNCSCVDSYIPFGSADGKSPVPVCASKNIVQDDCRYEIISQFGRGALPCDCPEPCGQVSYSYTVSMKAWPSLTSKLETISRLYSGRNLGFNTSDSKAVAENLLEFELYFEDLSYELFEEKASYTVVNYLSDLGGILGLWFGCAAFSIFEFFEFFADVIFLIIGKTRKGVSEKAKARM